MKAIIILGAVLLLISCSKEENIMPSVKVIKYTGVIVYNLPSFDDTTVCSRRFIADSVLWWEAPRVIIYFKLVGGMYSINNAVIRSTPSCIDSSFLIHYGSGEFVGDSLFESGTAEYIRYYKGKEKRESGTWFSKLQINN